jgi:proteasome lid subunit RPN8/RPN11
MKVILPKEIVDILTAELKKAGSNEIGGILMGEHVGENEFKVCDITIQRLGGSFAFFERAVHNVISSLMKFFERTERNYKRFNYLGEWHSHPSFAPIPSGVDYDTMVGLTTDIGFKGNFAALLIIKLHPQYGLEGTVNIFYPDNSSQSGELVVGLSI